MKNEFGIHKEAENATIIIMNLNIQQPSWKTDANVFLASSMQKTNKWKHARTKLILIIAEGPKQADPSPDSYGHYRKSGNMLTKCGAKKRIVTAIIIQKS